MLIRNQKLTRINYKIWDYIKRIIKEDNIMWVNDNKLK